MVAPISTMVPSSTTGQEAVLLGAVEAVHLVDEEDRAAVLSARRSRALQSKALRRSATPEKTAESCT